jgi:hypothetical protein
MSGTELSRVRTEFRLRPLEPINESDSSRAGPTLLCNHVGPSTNLSGQVASSTRSQRSRLQKHPATLSNSRRRPGNPHLRSPDSGRKVDAGLLLTVWKLLRNWGERRGLNSRPSVPQTGTYKLNPADGATLIPLQRRKSAPNGWILDASCMQLCPSVPKGLLRHSFRIRGEPK